MRRYPADSNRTAPARIGAPMIEPAFVRPAGRTDLIDRDLRFLLRGDGTTPLKASNPTATFARASAGTYLTPARAVATAVSGAYRLDYIDPKGGLLIEPQSQNIALQSETFQTTWIGAQASIPNPAGINVAAPLAPDGTATADKLVEDASAGVVHTLRQDVTLTDNTVYTASVHVQAGERTGVALLIRDKGGTLRGANFDLIAGTASANNSPVTYGMYRVTGSWWRVYVVVNALTGATAPYVRIYLKDAVNPYDGDGASGVYLWGAQLEAQSAPTSYVATVAAPVTRAADALSCPAAGHLDYRGGVVSLWARTAWAGADGASHVLLECGQSATQNDISIYKSSTSTLNLRIYGGTNNSYKQMSGAVTNANWAAGTWHHVAFAFGVDGTMQLWLDGAAMTTAAASGTWSDLAQLGASMFVGATLGSASQVNGLIRSLRIYGPGRVADADRLVRALYARGAS